MSAPLTLYTARVGSDVLRIERTDRHDLPFTLDCNRLRNGSPAYLELPRNYKTERGAKLAAARIIGDGLVWTPAANS
ncbi:TPA: hypothetical protein ACRN02_006783 [Pseudomonas aeruginosa]